MAGERDRRPLAVAWDEAREVLVVVLLAAALLHLVAPMIRYAGIDRRYPCGMTFTALSPTSMH